MQISKYDYQLFTLMKPAVFTWCLIHVLRKASLKRGNTSKTNITADLCNCSVCSTQVTAGNPDPDFFQKFLKNTGILEDLEKAGISEGDTVRMYGLEFDYYK